MANWIKSHPHSNRTTVSLTLFNSVVLINFILLMSKFGRTVMPTTHTKNRCQELSMFLVMIALTELRVTVPTANYY